MIQKKKTIDNFELKLKKQSDRLKRVNDEMKKDKFTITIDEKLNDIVNEYLDTNDIKRSNYIEKLIREDMEKRGKNIDRKF